MRQEIGQRLADAYLLSNMALSALRRGYAAGSIESSTAAMRLAEKLKHRDLQAPLRCVRAHAHAADASLASGSQQMGWQINGLVVRGA
jgi:hypothetical protein